MLCLGFNRVKWRNNLWSVSRESQAKQIKPRFIYLKEALWLQSHERLMNFYFLKARNNYMDLLIVSRRGERRGYNIDRTAGIFFGLLYERSVSCYLNTQLLILKLRLQWSGWRFEDSMLCEGIKLTLVSRWAGLPNAGPRSESFPDKTTIKRKCWI